MFLLKIHPWLAILLLALPLPSVAATLAGNWRLEASSSSSIKPWDTEILTIGVDGNKVSIARELSWDADRRYKDRTECVADGATVTTNEVKNWVDTWYNNCYIGADHSKRVTATWLSKDGTKLAAKTELRLEAQQGEVPVQIEDEYILSEDGKTMSLTERRSTRDQVLHFTFNRQ